MIYLLVKNYLNLLLSVFAGSFFILILGFYFIFRSSRNNQIVQESEPSFVDDSEIPLNKKEPSLKIDYSSIAGDDQVATKLDLSRAYIEAGRMALARVILKQVLENGNQHQRQEAKELLTNFKS